MDKNTTVHIIGAGFSGLSLAWELAKKDISVQIYESERVGGLIASHRTTTHLRETAANGVLWNPRFAKLADELGVAFRPTQKWAKKRFIFRDKKCRQWPLSTFETLKTFGYFMSQKFRVKKNNSLESWSLQKLGPFFTDYVLDAAIRGIFSIPSKQLDVRSVFNSFKKIFPGRSQGTYAPTDGMGALIEALQKKLEQKKIYIQKKTVTHLAELKTTSTEDIFIIATSAWDAALILNNSNITLPWLAELNQIKSSALTTVVLVWPNDVKHLRGFGCLFPPKEGFASSGVIFNHYLFEERGPLPSETWILSSEGDQTNDELIDLVLSDRKRLYPTQLAERPIEFHIQRWPKALPIYDDAVYQLTQTYLKKTTNNRIYLTGNYLGKIGLAKIYDSNILLSEKIKKDYFHA